MLIKFTEEELELLELVGGAQEDIYSTLTSQVNKNEVPMCVVEEVQEIPEPEYQLSISDAELDDVLDDIVSSAPSKQPTQKITSQNSIKAQAELGSKILKKVISQEPMQTTSYKDS